MDTHPGAGKLTGKIAVVTGATSGMGLASARLFRDHGAHVYITGRGQERLDDAVADLGGNVTGVRADSADLDDLDRLFAAVEAAHGRVDVLFANAGIGTWAPVTETTPASFDATFAVNARGTFFTAQKALPLMPDGASIILTGSTAAHQGLANISPYAASKAAVRTYATCWANDLAPRRIRVNVLNPGSIDSAQTLTWDSEMRTTFAETVPLGRWGDPREIATAALFLASEDSSYVNAAELIVDGGRTETRGLR